MSYAHEDHAYVRRLVAWLLQRGVDVWFDEEIPTGDRWSAVLRERVESAATLVLVMSPAAAASEWVEREVRLARSLGKPIRPLLLAGGAIFGLEDRQYEAVLDGRMPSEDLVARLPRRNALEADRIPRSLVRYLVGLVPNEADCLQERDLLVRLDTVLAGDGTAIVSQVLTGLGGVGKTQLAAALARRMIQRAALDALVWVTAQSRDAIVTAYAQAGREVRGADPSDVEAAAQAFLRWCATTTGQWLVVLDDLADPADLSGLWPPRTPSGRTVVTTRRRDAALDSQGQMISVGMFTEAEAHAYLTEKFAKQPHRLVEAAELAADVGHLPLMLSQAAAYIADQNITCADYRRRLVRAKTLVDVLPDAGETPDEYRLPVAAALQLSVEVADQLRPGGLAKPLLVPLSLLDPNGIPLTMVTATAMVAYVSAHRGPAARGGPVDAEQVRDAVMALSRLNLATVQSGDGADEQLVLVHGLVQRAAREQASPETLRAAGEAAGLALAQAWLGVQHDAVLAQQLRANTAALRSRSEDELWRPEAQLVLLLRAGDSLGDVGLVAEATAYFDELSAQAIARLGPDHPDTLTARGRLARWSGAAGDLVRAVAATEALLADHLRVGGPDHPDTLTTRNNLAYWRGEAGDPAGAVAAFEALLADQVRVLGPDHPDTLTTRNNLAEWRGEAGDPAGAVAAFEALLADRLRVRGPDHPGTLTTRVSLAKARGEAGDAAGAAAAAEAALADCQRVLGRDDPTTLIARNILGSMRWKAGDTAGAVAVLADLLADQLRVLGPDHPETMTTRANLASIRGEAGDPAGAVAALEALLADQLRVLGPDHPDTLTTRSHLVEWRGEAGDTAGAVVALEVLLADRLRVLGPDHPDTLTTRANLASMRGDGGDAAGAVVALEALLEDRRRVLGPDHPETLITRANLAFMRGQAGDLAGAAAALEALLVDQLRVAGPDHPDTLRIRYNLADWRGQAGDAAMAVAALEALLADRLRVLGPDHLDTLASRRMLAYWRMKATGDPAGAAAELERLLADQSRLLGPDHPDTRDTRDNLAYLRSAGR